MTPEAQRIAIARTKGYPNPRMGEFGRCYAGEFPNLEEVPDYLNDLNAMHEAEKALPGQNERLKYYDTLRTTVLPIGSDFGGWDHAFAIVHATAAQRAEAFLKTKGLWKEES